MVGGVPSFKSPGCGSMVAPGCLANQARVRTLSPGVSADVEPLLPDARFAYVSH
jgi:hypothetical protein